MTPPPYAVMWNQRAAAIKRVALYVHDIWAVLKRRATRLDQPAEVLTFYQLPLDGTVPKPTSQEQWLTLAAQVVKGDGDAVAAGCPTMENPTAAELQAVLDAARSESDDVAMADRAYDAAQEAAALRAQADELIAEVMAELRFNRRKPVLSLSKEWTRPALRQPFDKLRMAAQDRPTPHHAHLRRDL